MGNLTLARATLRSREIAVRLALGATRGGIVRQLLAEALVVSISGAVAGLLLAYWCVRAMLALNPSNIQRPELIGIDPAVFAFAAAASVLTTALFGLAPSIAASRADLNSALKTGGWDGTAVRLRSRQFLIAVETALALLPVAGAGLMLRSFHELLAIGVGFDTRRLATVDIALPAKRYPDGQSQSRFLHALIDRARSIPGVTAAGAIDNLPLHQVQISNFFIAGRPEPPRDALPMADFAHVSLEYFSTIGLPLRSGRFFTGEDVAVAEKDQDSAVIVNEAFAEKFFAGENPLGKRLLNGDRKHAYEIIAVVANYRPMGIENGTRPEIFWPYLKVSGLSLIARTLSAPGSFSKAIQNAV